MVKRNYSKKKRRKIHKTRRRNFFFRREILLIVFAFILLGTGYYLKQKISFYYAMYFNKIEHKKLTNNVFETERITKIIGENTDKVFGFDVSHYQRKEDIEWDSLSIANRSIPLQFVLLRATMGNRNADKQFQEFWELSKKNKLIRGAYHFYRVNEDPVKQANNFLENVKLEGGDLPPILDIEKSSRWKSDEKLKEDLKIWLTIVEKAYEKKPIIYTYYYFYKDFLADDFKDYPIWLANYNDVSAPNPENKWNFWQFSEKGIVYGINTKVDINVYNGGIWSLKRLTID
ncbi:glycoside hydrolase family 25 protein [Halpernia sp. GG3]